MKQLISLEVLIAMFTFGVNLVFGAHADLQ